MLDGLQLRRLGDVLRWALVGLACCALAASAATLWLHGALLDTRRHAPLVEAVTRDEAVIGGVADALTEGIFEALGLQARIAALPEPLRGLATGAATNARAGLRTMLAQELRGDLFQRSWGAIYGASHARAVAALRGEGGLVRAEDAALTLNLLPLVDDGLRWLAGALPGLAPAAAAIPTIEVTTPPEEARRLLGQAIGRELPPGLGEVSLLRGEAVDGARRLVRLLDTLVVALPLLTALTTAGALLVARDRPRALIGLGLGTAALLLLTVPLLPWLEGQLVAAATPGLARLLATAAAEALADQARLLALGLAAVGGVVALAGYLLARRAA